MSGAAINSYRRFSSENTARLTAAGGTDGTVGTYLAAASAVSRYGIRRLDAVAIETHATSLAAAAATTPAAQRVILSALRAHIDDATGVVDSVRQRSGDLALGIGALDYPVPAAPFRVGPDFPTGPIVWCLRPAGTFGYYRCSMLYPNLKVSSYWSPTDDTHG
jgi:hypothetical protein